jgi:NTE family protein
MIAGTSLGSAWLSHHCVRLTGWASGQLPPGFQSGRRVLSSSGGWNSDRNGFFSDMANLIRKGYFWGVTATKPAFISEKEYEAFIYPLIPDISIENTKIPFGCVATDIRNGKRILYTSGSLRRAVSASCALPGIFPPVVDGDMLLVAAVGERIRSLCRGHGADIVIAVDVSSGSAI